MKKSVFLCSLILALLAVSYAFAKTSCYELSLDGRTYSNTFERICVTKVLDKDLYEISLRMKKGDEDQVVGTFYYNLLDSVEPDRETRSFPTFHTYVFGIKDPQDSMFNQLYITITTHYDEPGGKGYGTIVIGEITYRFIEVD